MDVQRIVKKKSWVKTYWYAFPITLLVFISFAVKAFLGEASYIVEKSTLQFAEVQQGDFKVEISAIGQLKPENTLWISSQVSGRVEKILVKAGSNVNEGDVLAVLSNPELKRSLEKAKWELKAKKAEMQASIVQLESQLLEMKNSVDEAEFNYKSTKLKLDAETQLLKSGKGSISKIDYQRTSLSVEQQKQRWVAQKRRYEKMKNNAAANKVAQNARLSVEQSHYQSIEQQVKQLNIIANASGTVQEISLTLGQQINLGESVAVVADHKSLIAELKVQQLQVQEIAIGQKVVVDTRSTELNGKVVRIDPRVEAGMVTVDVVIDDQFPPEARPDLNIDGRIIINDIATALYVKRPAFAPKHSEVTLFTLSEDKNFINRKKVKIGFSSVNQVQIVEGLSVGEKIVTSDISKLIQHPQILVN